MKVLLAGGTGFIGQQLASKALQKGWDVHLIVHRADSPVPDRLARQGARLIKGDITQPESLQKVFSEVRPTHYFHNAGWYELGIPASEQQRMWEVNVGGLVNALAAAEKYAVEKIVLTSSTTALGDTGGLVVDEQFARRSAPNSWYEHTLHEARQIAMMKVEAGMPIVLGSPAQVIGPRDHSVFGIMLRLFMRGLLPPTLWAPDGAFSFTHVEDVAAGLVRVMEAGSIGHNYFFAGSIMTNREMIRLWKRLTGRSLPVVWIPRSMAMLVGHLVAPLLRLAGQPAFISPEVVRSSFVSFRYSDDKARRELDLPIRSAEQAWADTIETERT